MVFIARFNDYPLDVAHHGEAERIWIISREVWIVVRGLEHNAGMRLQKFHEIAVGNSPYFVKTSHNTVVHVFRSPLIHKLGLALGIEILRDMTQR